MNIGIIGFGHLGRAFAQGLLKSGTIEGKDLYICEVSKEGVAYAEDILKAHATSDLNEVVRRSDIVFFALKDSVFHAVCGDIDLAELQKKTVVSFMASVTQTQLKEILKMEVCRAIPTIAMKNLSSVTAYTQTSDGRIKDIFEKLGYPLLVDEEGLLKIIILASSGLGFAAYALDCFTKAGVALGFEPEVSQDIIAKTFISAIEIGDFERTAMEVSTKGGITERGVSYFDEHGMKEIVIEGHKKAYERLTGIKL